MYGHLASYTVLAGTQVKRGDIIGHAGVSGRTTGPHVHYEVRIKDAPVNPMRYLRYTSSSRRRLAKPLPASLFRGGHLPQAFLAHERRPSARAAIFAA